MPIKLANNASARLSAPLSATDVTVVLVPSEIGNFPTLAAGEWYPLTLVSADGGREITRATARSANLITVQRGMEGTAQRAFAAGSRAEIRITAGALNSIQDDCNDFASETATGQIAAAIAGQIQDNIDEAHAVAMAALTSATTSLQGEIETAKGEAIETADIALTDAISGPIQANIVTARTFAIDTAHADTVGQVAAEHALATAAIDALRTELLASIAAQALPPGFGPVPWSLATEPAGWIFADGRTLLSSTPYTALRTAYINASFPHGQDGSGNPKVPDMRGRTTAGLDNMGGGAAGRLTGATLGAALARKRTRYPVPRCQCTPTPRQQIRTRTLSLTLVISTTPQPVILAPTPWLRVTQRMVRLISPAAARQTAIRLAPLMHRPIPLEFRLVRLHQPSPSTMPAPAARTTMCSRRW